MCGEEKLYEEKAEMLKALAHPVRLRIVHGLLCSGCHNVTCMEHAIGQSQSCISQHLNKLKAVGIVKASRVGNEMRYEIAQPAVAGLVAAIFGEDVEQYVDV